MYNERLEKLVFQSPLADLERKAANDHEPETGPPEVPPPKGPSGQPWDNHQGPDDSPPMTGIFLAIILSAVVWLAVFGIIARRLM